MRNLLITLLLFISTILNSQTLMFIDSTYVNNKVQWKLLNGHIYPKTLSDSIMIGSMNSPQSLFEVEDLIKFDSITYSTHIGRFAGKNAIGEHNIFIGDSAGYNADNIRSKHMIAIGYNAGKNCKSINSMFIGEFAGYNTTTGDGNMFIGRKAGEMTTDGGENFAFGKEALRYNIHGSHNTAFGKQALRTDTNPNYVIAIGGNALQNGLNNVKNIGIGYAALNGIFGANAGQHNIAIGYESGQFNTGNYNIFIGDSTGHNNTANNNVFVGFQSGFSNLSGEYNVFNGTQAGHMNTMGTDNVFNGVQAGYMNTTGNENVFNGIRSGYMNTIGSENVFNGAKSGSANTTGYHNTFSGHESGLSNTTGYRNTFYGAATGCHNISGVGNIYIGYHAGYNALDSNKLYIENSNSTIPLIGGDFTNDRCGINILIDSLHSTLEIGGSVAKSITTITSNTTLNDTYYTVLINANSNSVTITLPQAKTCMRRIYVLKSIDVSNTVTVSTSGENIDHSSNYVFSIQDEVIKVQSDGTQWWIIE